MKQFCVLLYLAKIQKWQSFFKSFPILGILYCLDTLEGQKFRQNHSLSPMVKEIEAIWCVFKMSGKQRSTQKMLSSYYSASYWAILTNPKQAIDLIIDLRTLTHVHWQVHRPSFTETYTLTQVPWPRYTDTGTLICVHRHQCWDD